MLQKYYEGTSRIIELSTEIGRLIGIVDSNYLQKPTTKLRRDNKIKTIYSSLAIEGNTLSVDQVSDMIDNKRVTGPPKDIIEVKNAIEVYDHLREFDPLDEASYLRAHQMLMKGLIDGAGNYRTKSVGIFKGSAVAHMAPPAWNVDNLMKNLFRYLNEEDDTLIIKSCVFHYEMEFVHPFMDGNGRMGRLWQTLLLMKYNPVFEYLPIEGQIKENQQNYYDALAKSDKAGICTAFVEYMLEQIFFSLEDLIETQRRSLTNTERIEHFIEFSGKDSFTRKDYMTVFKDISTATATRDLKYGTENGYFKRSGKDRTSEYQIIKK
ncbi:Fic family protein [Neolewinella xylanilytica]|uniref:Fic family protein n=1 Tax=Neolewinella xylanilytica TaxID=1514080 RepID=A0A2S6I6F0_9BACT|nr:Fic family protein [Neolewinella xylanilytica]PPK86736.1 Fic family protein [Neolewinella xylanilytica]